MGPRCATTGSSGGMEPWKGGYGGVGGGCTTITAPQKVGGTAEVKVRRNLMIASAFGFFFGCGGGGAGADFQTHHL